MTPMQDLDNSKVMGAIAQGLLVITVIIHMDSLKKGKINCIICIKKVFCIFQ